MDDTNILERITKLSGEEIGLDEHHAKAGQTEDRLARLTTTETELDQCWDYQCQRRTR